MATVRLHTGVLDLGTGELRGPGGVQQLTDIERGLVAFLLARDGEPASRDELQTAVWGYRPGILSRTVFTTVGRVRRKLEADPSSPVHLLTVPGEGYAFHAEATPELSPSAASWAPLPPERAPMLGRAGELQTLRSLLGGSARLVTLHGPGGVGKTRLAQAIAAELSATQPVAFVALAGAATAADVPALVAQALDLRLAGSPDDLGELLLGLRQEGPGLLVLDNAEHLLPEVVDLVTRLLDDVPGLRLLLTSRRRLGAPHEHLLQLGDLELPRDGARLEEAAAGTLILRAAGEARAGWTPSAAEREDLAEVCALVGGSPLALELAASWLRLLEPGELTRELRQSHDLLRTEAGPRPARHRSVAVALEASWRLLDPRAARALEALSLFQGAFDRQAAQEVAGADLMVLGQLVDSAMIRRVEGGFELHPLLRRDARRRLHEAAERAQAAGAAYRALWLGRLARAFEEMCRAGAGEAHLVDALGGGQADLVAAWRQAVEAGEAERLLAHGVALHRYLDAANLPRVATELFGPALAALPPEAEAVRSTLGLFALSSGGPPPPDLAGAVACSASAPPDVRALALVMGGIGAPRAGCTEAALGWLEEAGALADAGPDRFLGTFARAVRGAVLLQLGEAAAAREVLLEASRRWSHPRGLGRTLVHLGEATLHCEAPAEAERVLGEALSRLRHIDDRAFIVRGLTVLAAAAEAQGQDATPVLREAVEEAVRSRLPRPFWLAALGRLATAGLAGASGEARLRHAVLLVAAQGFHMTNPRDREVLARGAGLLEARLDELERREVRRRARELDDIGLLALLEAG